MKSGTLIALVFGCFLGHSVAQPVGPPTFNCLGVDENGNVIVNYTQPPDPNGYFTQYHIHYANNLLFAGASDIIHNDYNNTSFVQAGGTGATNAWCYYLTTDSYDGVNFYTSAPSDTLCTIFLVAIPSISPQGYANLVWNSPFPYGVPQGPLEYKIWMEYPIGTWTQVGTVPYGTNVFTKEITVCNQWLNFQVSLETPGGCTFTSNVSGSVFDNAVPPAVPIVESVSIDHTTNDAVITWNQNPSTDTQGYIVYACNGAFVSIVDTVWGWSNTTFTDILANTAFGPVSYLVAAFDSCYSGIPPSPNTSPTADVCNTSVFLNILPYVMCDTQIKLTWTPYQGWSGGVTTYDVMMSTDNVNYTLLATLPGTQTNYNYDIAQFGLNHYFYIVAHQAQSGYSAQSNLRALVAFYPPVPSYLYALSTVVNGQKDVDVEVVMEPVPALYYFTLERRQQGETNWKFVNSTSASLTGNLSFTDNGNINTSVFSYDYRVIAQNACGVFIDTSNIARTILLEANDSKDLLANTVIWSGYGDWQNGVDYYNLHRSVGAANPLQFLTTESALVRYYQDDVSAHIHTDGRFCYRIEAVENLSSYGTTGRSWSNEVCVQQQPKIWIPNAFVVGGGNPVFFPVISFANFDEYGMVIFSRWGEIIFESHDISEGWNGELNGKPVQEGVYAYYIWVKDGEGKLHERRGTVTMLTAD